MDGFWSSFSKWFSEKTGTPLYFTYMGFFIVWNWKFFDIVFLESSSLFVAPKVEYIYTHLYFNLHNSVFLQKFPTWTLGMLNSAVNISWHVIPPAVLTFLSIVYLPKIQKWALEKYLDSRFERKEMFAVRQRKYDNWILSLEKEKEKTLDEILEVKQRQVEQKKIIEETTSEEDRWDEEFESIKSNSVFSRFKEIVDIIYSNGGRTHKVINSRWTRVISSDILAFADTRGLITITNSSSNLFEEKIDFTKKGKFFASKIY